MGLVVRDGSIGPELPAGETGVVPAGDGASYLIYQELGELRGNNLFHSFKTFSIGEGEIARFTGSASILNIVSRVNGGATSELLGTLESTVPGANLFLLNPYGVFFGPNSQLDVQGSFYASTADVLRFDGGEFSTRETARPAMLSSAAPASFGFLQAPTGGITFDRARLAVSEGQTLSAVGGEVLVFGGATGPSLAAPGGRVQLVSAASPGVSVPLDASDLDVSDSEAGDFGNVSLTDGAVLQVDSESGGLIGTGRIVIRGGRFVMLGGGLNARTNNANAGDPTAVDVAVTEGIVIGAFGGRGATIQSFSRSTGGATGDIRFAAKSVTLRDGARVVGQTGGAAPGAGVYVDANEVILESGAQIFTRSTGAGDAGTVAISGPSIEAEGEGADRAESVTLASGAQIFTRGGAAIGSGGKIELTAQTLEISGEGTEIFSMSEGDSAGRTIHVAAGRVHVSDGGRIYSEALGNEAGAVIEIGADGAGIADSEAFALEVTDLGAITSLAKANGTGGAIQVTAADARVTDGGQIASETQGGGPGGSISVTADGELELSGEGQITTRASSSAQGRGGDLTVRAGSVKVTGGEDLVFVAQISALTASKGQLAEEGRGGDLLLEAGSVELIDGGQIRATTDGDAAAGDLTVTAREGLRLPSSDCQGVCIRGVSLGGARPSGIFATSGSDPDTPSAEQATGDGGNVVVNARRIELESGGEIGASTFGTGDAGNLTLWNEGEGAQLVSIRGDPSGEKSVVATQGTQGAGGNLTIFADDLELVDGGEVSASTTDSGNSGSVVIEAQRILIQGKNPEAHSGVFAQTVSRQSNAGNAGSIDLSALESLTVVDGGEIGVASFGGGFAGDLTIRGGGSVEVARSGLLSALAAGPIPEASLETASDIVIADAAQLTVASGGTITAETLGEGFGGSISIRAKNVALSGDARITAQTSGVTPDAGPAGDISITEADQVSLTSGATITTETSGTGQGGQITIREVGDVFLSGGSGITSRSTGASGGDAGAIVIAATKTFNAKNSEITTTALDAGGGRISIQAGGLVSFVDSLVETTVQGSSVDADAGDIFIPFGGEEAVGVDPAVPGFVVVNRSIIRANAEVSGAGDITIDGSDVLISADSLIQAYSKEGVSGEIQISSPDTDIASQVTQLASSFVDPSDRLLPPCVARTERTGSFMVQSREALPRSLDAPLPSTLGGAPGADGIPPASGATDCSVFQESS